MKWILPKCLVVFIYVAAVGMILPVRSLAAPSPPVTWSVTYDGGSSDKADGVAVDSSGNVYTVGAAYVGTSTSYFFHTIKYNSAGGVVWNVTDSRTNPYASNTVLGGVAVDSSGNVYVTGNNYDGANFAIRTIKYNSAGSVVWNTTGPAGSTSGIAVDSSGNAYVSIGQGNVGIVKYNSAGTVVSTFNDSNATAGALSVAVDSSGNEYAAGFSYNASSNSYDVRTIKVNSGGTLVWSVSYDTGTNDYDSGEAVAVDSSGNVYVGATSSPGGFGGGDVFRLIKYNSAGSIVWNVTNGSGATGNFNEVTGVTVDASGNAYIAGYSSPGAGSFFLTIKYNSAGSIVWSVLQSGASFSNLAEGGVAVDSSNNVYTVGMSWNGTNQDFQTTKYGNYCTGPLSFAFTDPTLTAGTTPIRAVHINELRTDVNSLLTNAGTSTVSFIDPTLTAGTTPIRAAHINELRSALANIYTTCGQSAPTYTDATLTAGSSLIRTVDISELRTQVQAAP